MTGPLAATVDVIAAVAAVVGVLIGAAALIEQVRARRPLVSVNFSGMDPHEKTIELRLEIRNDSSETLQSVRGVFLVDGSPVAGTEIGPFTLPPRQPAFAAARLPRPEIADLQPGGNLTFHGKRVVTRLR